ncbi:MAG: hypothetical protein A2898_00995 [Candidatus Kerfeldbacteria bacterium RIFCSPLOWO2_01_FULL_48_11]|uniref:DNA-(apurinic or apyrimidinic site) lyase n=1 Tax=Candidatus Kerfeldbacteria bacterium RIFCSPLOWO2_01_FULL_48_11 TaxID=1798543 RepID=A0A1G2B638_9BACT|nr:MAG: 3-methyladenine DNA glycosylase/8-oxoguanine DNA glycosylase [Parcubacteria group bacterium GW2011_GWA2_48_9]KKW16440.1 MAG: 3-methyladenine DNA glycosylase/8-oxoguanine DNA glycosylase [Parcubacteria group bacterium GW2011_GWC2_49_9]OGY84668.1 MAG: hypothetical protein A2898_00995 [Candidatus Kerfeldbacteria bacterium RIFCSPLOWO2_01_FULL_48_11]
MLIRLFHSHSFTIRPLPPFHFDGTFHKPSHFPNKLQLDRWEPGKYWQSLWLGKKLYGLKIVDRGATAKPALRVTVYTNTAIKSDEIKRLKREIAWRFELDTDLKEFNRLAKKDKRFFPIFKKWIGMRNASQYTLYELLVIAIVLQNATVRRSQQMLDALLAKFGTHMFFDRKEFWAIWLPAALQRASEQTLRNLKIGYRAKFFKRLSKDFSDGKIDEHRLRGLSKKDAKEELMHLYGVGPETARILLFEAFHHVDTFDHVAPWQGKIYSRLFYGKKAVAASQIRKDILKRYGTYSMLAVHYIWEDVFWRRKNEHIEWLEREIRL